MPGWDGTITARRNRAAIAGPELPASAAVLAQALHPLPVLSYVVAVDAPLPGAIVGADLEIGSNDGFRVHLGLTLEGLGLVGIPVVAIQGPIQADTARGAEKE